MGQAFVTTELKYGNLYPFIQAQEKCEISLFHPFVYPIYRAPLPEEPEMLAGIQENNNEELDKTMETPQGENFFDQAKRLAAGMVDAVSNLEIPFGLK